MIEEKPSQASDNEGKFHNVWSIKFRSKHNTVLLLCLKFGYSEKATKFEKIFHIKFDATQ